MTEPTVPIESAESAGSTTVVTRCYTKGDVHAAFARFLKSRGDAMPGIAPKDWREEDFSFLPSGRPYTVAVAWSCDSPEVDGGPEVRRRVEFTDDDGTARVTCGDATGTVTILPGIGCPNCNGTGEDDPDDPDDEDMFEPPPCRLCKGGGAIRNPATLKRTIESFERTIATEERKLKDARDWVERARDYIARRQAASPKASAFSPLPAGEETTPAAARKRT